MLNIEIVIFLLLVSSCSRSIDGIQMVREKKTNPYESIIAEQLKLKTKKLNNEAKLDSILIGLKKSNEETLTASTDISIPEITHFNSDDFKIDWSANNLEECDIIVLKTGEEISSKVTEIGQDEIKYKKCDNLSGPTYTINKSLVFMIKYSNGTKDVITPYASSSNNNTVPNNNNSNENIKTSTETSTHWAAIVAFISSLLGLFIFGVFFGLAGIIFSIVGLSAIKSQPEKFKGKGLAVAGLIIGIVGMAAWIFILSILLSGYYY